MQCVSLDLAFHPAKAKVKQGVNENRRKGIDSLILSLGLCSTGASQGLQQGVFILLHFGRFVSGCCPFGLAGQEQANAAAVGSSLRGFAMRAFRGPPPNWLRLSALFSIAPRIRSEWFTTRAVVGKPLKRLGNRKVRRSPS